MGSNEKVFEDVGYLAIQTNKKLFSKIKKNESKKKEAMSTET